MISHLYAGIQKLRWAADPNRWLITLLRLSKKDKEHGRGLILIQIDGLSFEHFRRAAAAGRLPFLKTLQKTDHYQLLHHYSGVPSCTPSIQGELFYGARHSVPAFKFKDHRTRRIFTFYDSEAAVETESRLQQSHEGLLKEGSSYCNIFRGGAGENAHFCVASIGWTGFLKALNPLALIFLALFNFFNMVRLVLSLVIEFVLAVVDFAAGSLKGFGTADEFKFILSRLIVTVGLREFSVLGAKIDAARGLPVIHVNFFGYDDQAHRRGPGSRFAYWALRGIDASVRRLWMSARNSPVRDYELWIYSDHGQEEVVPYPLESGKKIENAVEEIFRGSLPDEIFSVQTDGREKTIGCRGAKWPGRPREKQHEEIQGGALAITAQGPVGFIYPHRPLTAGEKEMIAGKLAIEAKIPLVLTDLGGRIFGFTENGKFSLPQEGEEILGSGHPFGREAASELAELCRHPDAGDFLISGWRSGRKAVSFPMEFGSHAGPGPHETDGFALLPGDIRAHDHSKPYLRPGWLRETALGFLRGDPHVFHGTDAFRRRRGTLKVMTYNVHSCMGMDRKVSPERIARVIARQDPDIVALQELDSGRLHTFKADQAREIAALLDMKYHFHPAKVVEEEMYGNAVFSRYPMKVIKAGSLPRLWAHRYFEPRGAVCVEIETPHGPLRLINTHLSLWGKERRRQAEALCGEEWLGSVPQGMPVILCGDMNASPGSQACRIFSGPLSDAQLKAGGHSPLNTWFGHLPMGRIDHIFVSSGIEVVKIEVPSFRLEKAASDHLPLTAEIRF